MSFPMSSNLLLKGVVDRQGEWDEPDLKFVVWGLTGY